MAADSDGTLTAVVICEGNLHDPDFPKKFRSLLGKLKNILEQPKKSKKLKVNKIEPWNSVRVTLSIPKDAAAKLRQLAADGNSALRALGILSVQLEGDTVISLRLVGQEIVLRTDNAPSSQQNGTSGADGLADLTRILAGNPMQTASASCTTITNSNLNPAIGTESIAGPSRISVPQSPSPNLRATPSSSALVNGPTFDKPPIFKSPNTICPRDGKLPMPPVGPNVGNVGETTREYPFESMTQARVIQRRENSMAVAAAALGGQTGQSTIAVQQTSSIVGTAAQQLVVGPNQTMVIGPAPTQQQQHQQQQQQQQQPPPPLAVQAKPMLLQQQLQPQQNLVHDQLVKPQFLQPPPPPYPNLTKGQLSVQHQQQQAINVIQQIQACPPQSSSGNNIAISSPLLVNLLQNDGVGHIKQRHPSASPKSPASLADSSPIHQAMSPNVMKTVPPQPPEILMSTSTVSHGHNSENVTLSGGSNQQILNNSSSVNRNSLNNPVMTVPSSPQSVVTNVAAVNTNTPQSNILTANMIGPPLQQQQLGIRIQQRIPMQQHQQQQILLQRQQHILQQQTTQMQRFPQQQQTQLISGMLPGPQQQMSVQAFRQPQIQQNSPQQQPYCTPQSPHPSASGCMVQGPIQIQANMASGLQQNLSQQILGPQQQQMIGGTSYNHPRWPFKPMDSATKSSFQEFTRYQMQYNLQQQMNQSSDGSEKGGSDPLGLGSLSDLDELTKNDLDSLLPSLNVNDLDSLLDADLDLIGPEATVVAPPILSASNVLPQNPVTSTSMPQQISVSGTAAVSNVVGNITGASDNSYPPRTATSAVKSIEGDGKQKQYLINPLTGELEPIPSEESEAEAEVENMDAFNEFNSEVSNSLFSDDDNSSSTMFSKASDHSDTERSSNSEASNRSRYSKSSVRRERKDLSGGVSSGGSSTSSSKKNRVGSFKSNLLRDKLQQGIKEKISSKIRPPKEKTKAKLISTTLDSKDSPAEKIKLRLKLEKSEPVMPAYKVDVTFVQSPKRAQSAASPAGAMSSSSSTVSAALTPASSPTSYVGNQGPGSSSASPAGEELRVPPLHISLRGKNSIIIKNSKKDRKKSQSGGEEDDGSKKNQYKRNNFNSGANFDDQSPASLSSGTRYNSPSHDDQSSLSKNHASSNIISRLALAGGKPTRLPTAEDYMVYHGKSEIIENGQDFEMSNAKLVNRSGTSMLSSKRNASEQTHSPNGLICPETKKRRMSQSSDQQPQTTPESDPYGHHPKGPIGSTNVGTLPQHSSLTKNQKSNNNNNNNNNNSQTFSSKTHKILVKSGGGKPLVVVKSSLKTPQNLHNTPSVSSSSSVSSLNNLSTKNPDKSPPPNATMTVMQVVATSTSIPVSLSSSVELKSEESSKNLGCSSSSNSNSSSNKHVTYLLPQGRSDAISEEKFKQKLLEMQNIELENIPKIRGGNGNNDTQGNSEPLEIMKVITTPSSEKVVPTTVSRSIEITSSKSTKSIDQPANEDRNKESSHSQNWKETKKGAIEEEKQEPSEQINNATNLAANSQQLESVCQQQPGSVAPSGGGTPGNARGSPGSQAQGEDSGIESMDALSEKSPHQSSSPQQGEIHQPPKNSMQCKSDSIDKTLTALHSKPLKPAVEELTAIGDIEAALAKLEGSTPDHFLTPVESPSQKLLNGDHRMKEDFLLENLSDEKIIFCAPKLEHHNLESIILGVSDKQTRKECCDLNENKEIVSKILLDPHLVDECCKNTVKNTSAELNKPKVEIKVEVREDFDTEELMTITTGKCSTAKIVLQDSVVIHNQLTKVSSLVSTTASPTITTSSSVVAASAPSEKDTLLSKVKIEEFREQEENCDSNNKTSTAQQTKAASEKDDQVIFVKEVLTPISIEIPLHVDPEAPRVRTRASSKLESPLDVPPRQSPQLQLESPANNIKANLRIERLSPKILLVSGKGVGAGKRKRQGSESSTQSGVSDDTPGGRSMGGGKKARLNASSCSSSSSGTDVHAANCNIKSKKSQPVGETNLGGKITAPGGKTSRKNNEESSDSDEPLIEIAGKVRSSKLTATPKSAIIDKDKVLRIHRVSQIRNTPGVTASGTISSTTTVVNHSNSNNNHQQSKTIRGATCLLANTSSAVVSINAQSQGNVTTVTRGSTTNSANNANSDDKIGTRRSVRASAAANKIIYSRSGNAPATAASINIDLNKANAIKNNHVTPSDTPDARRKTRSAAGSEPTTEGRRRKGSPDSK